MIIVEELPSIIGYSGRGRGGFKTGIVVSGMLDDVDSFPSGNKLSVLAGGKKDGESGVAVCSILTLLQAAIDKTSIRETK